MTPTPTTPKEQNARLVREMIAAKKAGDTAAVARIEEQLAAADRRVTAGMKLQDRERKK